MLSLGTFPYRKVRRSAPGRRLGAALVAALLLPGAAVAQAKTSHAGWPEINGVLKMHKADQNDVMRGVPDRHNELLGGHGHDLIIAGNAGDVIWGDYKEGGQPTTQFDRLYGGAGNDFIYASHGTNFIRTGGGRNVVHAHFGRGRIRCGSASDIVFISHRSRPGYRLIGCRHISYKTLGY
jgi:Ca2+-binding RTX toxin-like protein